jgi:hypothetical protein
MAEAGGTFLAGLLDKCWRAGAGALIQHVTTRRRVFRNALHLADLTITNMRTYRLIATGYGCLRVAEEEAG